MRNSAVSGLSWGLRWYSRLAITCVLVATACQGSIPPASTSAESSTSISDSNPSNSSVDLTFDDLIHLGLTREEALAPCREKPLNSYCEHALQPPPFDLDAAEKLLIENFANFRLGQNDAWWLYSEQCSDRTNRELLGAEAANLRSYLTDMGLPPYNLKIEILDIRETAPGFAEATTQFSHLGTAVAEPNARMLAWEETGSGTWRWRFLDCDKRQLKAGWQCSEAFGEHRHMCLPLWDNTLIKDYECDLKNPEFFGQLYQLMTTPGEFSLNNPEHLAPICDHRIGAEATTSTTSESVSSFDPDAVAADITEAFDKFRFGNDDAWPYLAKPCRLEEWDQRNQSWATRPEYVVAEMAILRAYTIEFGLEPFDLQIEVLEVTEQGPGIAEATTRLLHLGEPLSDPGTQDLQLENGVWKGLNCDKRELKAGWQCSAAFGEDRGMCMPFWNNYVRDRECELNNPDFFPEAYRLITRTEEELVLNVEEELDRICNSGAISNGWDS